LFKPEAIAWILDTAFSLWPAQSTVDNRQSKGSPVARRPSPVDVVEITLEANPGTISHDKLRGFRAAGINRISFGVQSFHPHHLRTLGRIHGRAEALEAVELARQAGFTSVSMDLIFGLPDQTLSEWESDLTQACSLSPDHISAYNLTYEEGTAFHLWRAHGRLRQLPEEIEVAMLTRTQEILGAAGYQQYEISNYARSGFACRHNLNYWRSGSYLGVGAGAHSHAARHSIVESRESNVRPAPPEGQPWGCRWSNEKSPSGYLRAVAERGHARVTSEALDARQARAEFVFLGLRCCDGFAAAAFHERFGDEFPALFPHVSALGEGGLLRCTDERWHLTPQGLLLADSVFVTFL
jgi:oxygen-independent coproporphyrinogen-3 oxidase